MLFGILQRGARELPCAASYLPVRSGGYEDAHNLRTMGNDREHECGQPIFRGVIEIRPTGNECLNKRRVASMCRIHERGLSVLIECVNISSRVKQGKDAPDIAGQCCFKPIPVQMAPDVLVNGARR